MAWSCLVMPSHDGFGSDLRALADDQPTRNDTGIITAAALSGQIQPSA